MLDKLKIGDELQLEQGRSIYTTGCFKHKPSYMHVRYDSCKRDAYYALDKPETAIFLGVTQADTGQALDTFSTSGLVTVICVLLKGKMAALSGFFKITGRSRSTGRYIVTNFRHRVKLRAFAPGARVDARLLVG